MQIYQKTSTFVEIYKQIIITMNYGIISLPLVPVRFEPSDLSEMTTQLLFGEMQQILEVTEKWLFVRNLPDNYSGWVDRNSVRLISADTYNELSQISSCKVTKPYSIIYNQKADETMLIPGGSTVYDLIGDEFMLGDERWCMIEPYTPLTVPVQAFHIINLAKQFLNAPYLWGGKSVLGIDCASLVQIVYSIAGIDLPRDAQDQVEFGKTVDFITEAVPGDLAFFENELNEIVHVGILTDTSKIIHASGWVKIDNIDSQGIISSTNGEYTHRLRVIKRIME
jgi:gamma-D-glutamyl-L-lysine dipeptidyl-peptidase